RQIGPGPHAARFIGGRIARPILDQLFAGSILRTETDFLIISPCAAAHQLNHGAGGKSAGVLDIDGRRLRERGTRGERGDGRGTSDETHVPSPANHGLQASYARWNYCAMPSSAHVGNTWRA